MLSVVKLPSKLNWHAQFFKLLGLLLPSEKNIVNIYDFNRKIVSTRVNQRKKIFIAPK